MTKHIDPNVDFLGALAQLERRNSKPKKDKTPVVVATVRRTNNGWQIDPDTGERIRLGGETTDWKDRFPTGKPNVQMTGQQRGAVVAGAGKGQKDKRK